MSALINFRKIFKFRIIRTAKIIGIFEVERFIGHTIGILRTEKGYAIRIIDSNRRPSNASGPSKEDCMENCNETIIAASPELKQSFQKIESTEIETKRKPALFQSTDFCHVAEIVSKNGPKGMEDLHLVYKLSIDDYAFLFDMFYGQKSLKDIAVEFRRQRSLPISPSTALRRIIELTPYMCQAVKYMLKHEWQPKVGQVWEMDGTLLEGVSKWLIVVRDIKTCMPLSWITSEKEDARTAEKVLRMSLRIFRTNPACLRIDGSKALLKGSNKVLRGQAQVIVNPRIGRAGQNQSIEGFFSQLEAWVNSKRGLHSKECCAATIDGWMLYYSFVKPCPTLNSLTPAEDAGIHFGWFGKWHALVTFGIMFKNGKLGRKTGAVNKIGTQTDSFEERLDKYF